MNFLAHQYLSFGVTDLELGNLYGEIVRGREFPEYPLGIQNGINLHRQIDSFTDSHPIVKRSTTVFHENYGKYAPVIVDVLYDYYLIKNWGKFSDVPYESFVQKSYALFRRHFEDFPPKLQYIMHHLLNYDWFRNYITIEGIEETLRGISGRSSFKNEIYKAVIEMKENDDRLNEDFLEFFPEIINHCKKFISEHQDNS